MTIKTHGRMMTSDTIGITQLDLQDGTANQAIVTDGQGVLRFATVGAGGSVGSSVYVEDIRTGDGTTTTFTLSTAAPYEESILVFIDGVAQPTSSFTLPSTTSLTFSPAPGNGAAIRICHLGIASSVANNSITGAHIAMGGDTPGDVLFYNGTDYQRLTIGTALQVFRTNAAVNAPEWVDATTATLPATGADGNVLTSDGTNWVSEIPLSGVGGEPISAQVFTTNGTWTKPSGVTKIEVWVVGGGGNSSSGDASPANGGGGGGTAYSIIDVTNITSATCVVGVSHSSNYPKGDDAVFSGTGITTMTGQGGQSWGTDYTSGAFGGTGVGGNAGNFAGGDGDREGSGHSQFGGVYGQGAGHSPANSGHGSGAHLGGPGIIFVKEYADASGQLAGEKLVATQLITADGAGTWTRPAGITKIEVWCVGGGGTGPAGGGGGTAYLLLDVSEITTIAYLVGGSDVSSTFAQPAGTPGLIGQRGTNGAGGGTGGSASNGTHNFTGSDGSDGGHAALDFAQYGRGANAALTNGNGGCIMIKEYSDASLVGGLFGTITETLLLTQIDTPRSGTWTNISNVKQLEVSVAGAGGWGGQMSGDPSVGGGPGGPGGYVKRLIDVSNITSLDWVIGLGGTASPYRAPTASFFGSNGTLQTTGLTVTVVSGAITAIAFSGGGSSITVAPHIVIESNADHLTGSAGTGATATATISGGAVTGITVTNGGTGYVTGEVQAFFGIYGGFGGVGTNGSPSVGATGLTFGHIGNLGSFNDTQARAGEGGGGEPAGGGGRGTTTGNGAIYYREYR